MLLIQQVVSVVNMLLKQQVVSVINSVTYTVSSWSCKHVAHKRVANVANMLLTQ